MGASHKSTNWFLHGSALVNICHFTPQWTLQVKIQEEIHGKGKLSCIYFFVYCALNSFTITQAIILGIVPWCVFYVILLFLCAKSTED